MTDYCEYDLVDVAIIGAGPAGLSAATYTARAGLRTVVFGDPYASLLAKAQVVENFITWTDPDVKGLDIIEKMVEHATQWDAKLIDKEIKQIIKCEGGGFQVISGEGTKTQAFCAHAVIVASGTKHKKLGVKGEEEFYAKGVGYCTICDGPLYKGKPVAIAGFGNEAAQAALRMASIATHVSLVATKPRLGVDPEFLNKIEKAGNIDLYENTRPLEILGDEDQNVTGFKFKYNGKEKEIEINAVFVEVGVVPSSALVAGLGVQLNGQFIKVGSSQETNVPGIYAAGDITGGIARQAIISSGDGARAAITAIDYIKKLGVSASKLKTTQWGTSLAKTSKISLEKEIAKGVSTKGQLFEYVHADKGFTAGYERYTTKDELIELINTTLPKARMIIISAHWCPDCRRNVPRMAKIADKLPEWDFIVENRDEEGVPEKYNVRKIPTFIVQKNDKEIGRIIENPKLGSLEADLLAIVKEEEL